MLSGRQEPCRQEPTSQARPACDEWRKQSLRSSDEITGVIEALVAEMAAAGFPPKDLFAVRLALEEALVNAVKHGNQGDPSKEVQLRYHLTTEQLLVEVEDEGQGFDPREVPDPLDPENLERTCGRGLFLMRTYMTWVRYSERGNCVTMCKARTT
jgi:serine/threonine-protein kinase RsbW